jgi:RNA polymerase sigma-70 factor (ECF subfamily)
MTENNPAERAALEYRERIFGYLRSKNVPEADRDDVYGEILLKAARQAKRYDSAKASASTWIYIITRSAVADYFRKQKPEHPLDEDIPGDFDMESRIEYEAELHDLASCLERLPERERQIVILRYYRGMEYAGIAIRLGLSEANARKICSRALDKLRKLMNA